MKTICSMLLMAMVAALSSSCVSRETTADSAMGSGNDKVIEKKIIWIWQDEYRNQ